MIANVQSQISGHTHVELIERTKQEQETKFITEYMMSKIASYMYLYDIILSNLLVTNVLVDSSIFKYKDRQLERTSKFFDKLVQ